MSINDYSLLRIYPEVLSGLPHVKDTRIATSVILKVATDYLLEQYPKLNTKQVLQALKFSSIYEQTDITNNQNE